MKRTLLALGRGALAAAAPAFTAWAVLALLYAPLVPAPWNYLIAAVLALTCIACFVFWPMLRAALAAAVLPALVLIAFLQLRPTNDRPWQPEYARVATAERHGDVVKVSNIRNFAWTSETTATPAYYNAEFNLNDVRSVDLVVSHWGSDAIAHVFVSFGFVDGRHLAFSVETRRSAGQEYSTLAGFFRNYELFYVVADERDLIGVRTDMRREQLYIYRLATAPGAPRLLLLSYLAEANALAANPKFYNTLTDNCTTNVVTRVAAAADSAEGAHTFAGLPALRYSWKLLASGYADSYAYDLGRLDTRLPFADLKARSLVQRPEGATIGANFSRDIRLNTPERQ